MSWIALETARLFWSTSFLIGPQLQVKTSIFSNPSDFKALSHIDQPGSSLHIYEQSDLLSIHYLWSLLGVLTLTEPFLYKQPAHQKWTPDQVAVLCFAVGNGEMYRLAKQSSTKWPTNTPQQVRILLWENWTVNVDKTRVMIFNNCGKSLNNYSFKYGVNKLNNVKSYTYLGMTLNPYGNFSLAREELKKVRLKALYKLRKEMGENFRKNVMLTINRCSDIPHTSLRKWNLGCWL